MKGREEGEEEKGITGEKERKVRGESGLFGSCAERLARERAL